MKLTSAKGDDPSTTEAPKSSFVPSLVTVRSLELTVNDATLMGRCASPAKICPDAYEAVDTRNLVFYVTLAVFCLFLTVRSVEARRWQ